jgi:peptide/nickel transport system substrate-binding protein
VTKGPLTDNRVRTAIRHAVNYGGLINNIMGGAARPINTFIPAGFAGYQDVVFYREDLEKARQLLKEAGYPDGFEITMDHGDQTPNPEIAQAIQNSLARVGIKVKLNKLISAITKPSNCAGETCITMTRPPG